MQSDDLVKDDRMILYINISIHIIPIDNKNKNNKKKEASCTYKSINDSKYKRSRRSVYIFYKFKL